jgi:hypothetical protein
MDHVTAEIQEMDRLQFPLDFERRWNLGRCSTSHDMTDMWGPCRDGGVQPNFFADKKAWRAWLEAARTIVMDWEGFDDWDWYGLTDIRNIRINKLSVEDFRRLKWACEMSSAAYLSILGSKAGLCIYLYAYDVMHA